MAPLSFLEFDISQTTMLAYLLRFCWILPQICSRRMVSAPSQIFFLEI